MRQLTHELLVTLISEAAAIVNARPITALQSDIDEPLSGSHLDGSHLQPSSAQVVETSVTNNSPSLDSNHPDDLFQSRYVTSGFKPFPYLPKHSRLSEKF